MSDHPTDEALFDCAVHENPDVRAHVRGCGACEARYRRLAAGASLIETAGDPNAASGVNWRAIDPAILAAAEKTAADIRSGRLRAPRRVNTAVYIGVALAAAAAGVMIVRAGRQPAVSNAPAQVVARQDRSAPVSPRAPATSEPGAPVAGVVLMVVAPVTYTAPGGAPAAVTASTSLRQGGRIAADDHGGRAVLAMHAGYRLDARAGADVTLARLSSSEMLFELTKGEARVDGPAQRETRVSLTAGGWTVRAKGGAFVAGIEQDAIRVRVVSGKIGIVRGDGEEREVLAGDEILLAKNGSDVRVVSHQARDAHEIDTAFLGAEGRVFTLPALPPGAVVSVSGHGAMPAGLSVLRASQPVSLTARAGSEEFALALDPAREGPAAWTRGVRVATTAVQRVAGAQARVANGSAETVATPPATVVVTPPPTAPTALMERVPGSMTITDQARHAVEAQLIARIATCFEQCERSGTCGSYPDGWVYFDPNSDGSVSTPNASGFHAPALERCLTHQAAGLTLPVEFRTIGQRLRVRVQRPQ